MNNIRLMEERNGSLDAGGISERYTIEMETIGRERSGTYIRLSVNPGIVNWQWHFMPRKARIDAPGAASCD